jgi:hypothetical protein
MPPINPEIVLICPLCNRKGFLRKKQSKFHLSQKNMVNDFYGCLDYLSKLHFKIFFRALIDYDERKYVSLSLKTYTEFWIFYKIPLKKVRDFEINTIKYLITKCNEKQYDIIYSNDLEKSIHLKDIICLNDSNEKKLQQQENETIFISRRNLKILFYSIVFEAFKKCCEWNNLGIEESFEKEMIEGLKSLFFPMTLNVDRRNYWKFPLITTLRKKERKFNFQMDFPN